MNDYGTKICINKTRGITLEFTLNKQRKQNKLLKRQQNIT